jgi:hypothetical protein
MVWFDSALVEGVFQLLFEHFPIELWLTEWAWPNELLDDEDRDMV